jgi:hypothetical protein
MELVNQGQIETISMPDGWLEAPREYNYLGIGTRSVREFHAPEEPQAKITFFYRGLPVRSETAAALRLILAKEPHVLARSEIPALKEILRERADPTVFNLISARTDTISGRRVIVIEGRYKATESDLYEVLVDTEGDGAVIQEIYYQAPKDMYFTYLRTAQKAIKSIVWK